MVELCPVMTSASETLHIGCIAKITKPLQIPYHQALSKFWIGKKICDDHTASRLTTVVVTK